MVSGVKFVENTLGVFFNCSCTTFFYAAQHTAMQPTLTVKKNNEEFCRVFCLHFIFFLIVCQKFSDIRDVEDLRSIFLYDGRH